MSTVVVKLGVGNTASVMFALERLNAPATLTDDPARIADAERIILPGVGAAAHAMDLIAQKGLRDILCAFKRPLLGVCLGQQLLFDSSEEGDAEGLALLPGRVKRLPASKEAPAPHMGWQLDDTCFGAVCGARCPHAYIRDRAMVLRVELGASVALGGTHPFDAADGVEAVPAPYPCVRRARPPEPCTQRYETYDGAQ